jgi:hypothetical protein
MEALMRLIRQAWKGAQAILLPLLLLVIFLLPAWGAGTFDDFVKDGGF